MASTTDVQQQDGTEAPRLNHLLVLTAAGV